LDVIQQAGMFKYFYHGVLTNGVQDQDEGQAVQDTSIEFGILVS
jgi:hypothetical protein